jgi:flavin-dependent dehydrogenase
MNIAATDLSLADAARQHWPVIIVGAGIAGASLAHALASRGVRVLLLDRSTFPRAKTCGGCLNPRAVASLHRLGLGGLLESLQPNTLSGVEWRTPRGRSAFLPFPKGTSHPAMAVSRTALDAALVTHAIAAGVDFLPSVRALGSRDVEDHRTLQVRGRHQENVTLRAKLVLACDGLGSVLAREAGLARTSQPSVILPPPPRIGLSAILPPEAISCAPGDRILMVCAREGYVGAVRVENHQWNIAAALRLDAVKRAASPIEMIHHILKASGISLNHTGDIDQVWTSTPPGLVRSVVRPWDSRLLLIGDSSGYVEPITGEGMAWALAAAEAALPFATVPWSSTTGPAWEAAWRVSVARRRHLVHLGARVAASPLATYVVVAAIGLLPAVASRLTRTLVRDAVPDGAR